MITIKHIAELANVSRGTVDKVINNRPGVKKETRERIEKLIKDIDYTPNPLGKALATCKTPIKIGIILVPVYNQFIQLLVDGIRSQEKELSHHGVEVAICTPSHHDPMEQLVFLQNFREQGVKYIAILPLYDTRLIDYANKMVEDGFTIITLNSRINEISSKFFLGQNPYKAGRTAAELVEKLVPSGNIGLIISSMLLTCHQERQAGFRDRLGTSENYTIIDTTENKDSNTMAFNSTLNLLRQEPDLQVIYITGGGIKGVVEALELYNLKQRIKLICHDLTADSITLLKNNTVDFVIDQMAFDQGRLLVSSLYEYHINGRVLNPESANIPIIIRTQETLD